MRLMNNIRKTQDYVKTKKLEFELNKEAREMDFYAKKEKEIKKLENKRDSFKKKVETYEKIDKLKSDINKNQQKLKLRTGMGMMRSEKSSGSLFMAPKSEFEGVKKRRML